MLPTHSSIYNLSLKALRQLMEEMGERPYHAGQVFRWLYQRQASSFADMTDLSKDLRVRLSETFTLDLPEKVEAASGKDAEKWLLRLSDGLLVECVRIASEKGDTACLSTQAGCRLACAFCASGRARPVRNLTPGEMVGQLLLLTADAPVNSLVFMGMGEPFLNYDNLMECLAILHAPEGLNIGARRITISTAGMVPEIYRFAGEGSQVNLAVSLNAPNDQIRRKLMPIARYYPLERLLPACRHYVERTHRRLSFEYTLIQGANDARSHATELARLIKHNLFHLNIIPYNPISPCRLQAPKRERVRAFAEWLRERGVKATVRRSPGREIHAACGQLAGGRNKNTSQE
jgi:23S rRNA (adenine2503-C2)-methyltransferase